MHGRLRKSRGSQISIQNNYRELESLCSARNAKMQKFTPEEIILRASEKEEGRTAESFLINFAFPQQPRLSRTRVIFV